MASGSTSGHFGEQGGFAKRDEVTVVNAAGFTVGRALHENGDGGVSKQGVGFGVVGVDGQGRQFGRHDGDALVTTQLEKSGGDVQCGQGAQTGGMNGKAGAAGVPQTDFVLNEWGGVGNALFGAGRGKDDQVEVLRSPFRSLERVQQCPRGHLRGGFTIFQIGKMAFFDAVAFLDASGFQSQLLFQFGAEHHFLGQVQSGSEYFGVHRRWDLDSVGP